MLKKIIKETQESLDERKVHNSHRMNSYNELKTIIKEYSDNLKRSYDLRDIEKLRKKL